MSDGVGTTLVLQRGVFRGPMAATDAELYATVAQGEAARERHGLHLSPGATVDTDTYFGRLPAGYFRRWTTLTQVDLAFRFEATARSRVTVRGSDHTGMVHDLHDIDLEGADALALTVDLTPFTDGGNVWLTFMAGDGSLTIDDVRWSTIAQQPLRQPAVAICTFNRPADCVTTLATLVSDSVVAHELLAVCVVDQGTDRVDDQPDFPGVSAGLSDRFTYVQQPNLGGAGGFTRGMCEITERHDNVNIILMDDDIRCEPESVLRLNAFANLTTEPMIVGAQMLYLLHPTRLHVGAEEANLEKLRAGQWSEHALHDADMLTERQDRIADAGYNGWWTCLIPAEIIKTMDLPIPMFFQWDDIEYGIRANLAGGYRTVTLPGAAVWHMDFAVKDHDDWTLYFSIRNSLITAALHSDFDTAQLSVRLFREIAQYLVSMRYGLALTMIRSIEDFLVGPEILEDGGRQALVDIRTERKRFPETTISPESAIPGGSYDALPLHPAGIPPAKDKFDLVLSKRAATQLTGRVQRGCVTIPPQNEHWWHVSLFDQVVVTDASGSGYRVRTRDVRLARQLTKRTLLLMRRFRADGTKTAQAYRDALPRLTSIENWRRLFETPER
ncbi:UNVERIFIED_CONTAM: galactofuranosylgalactofuranosylrhamnosyl-N-acetylglucosaminyl-diphospho-decaprenol beta-1,5/1,6-galactofuranosyltransferase [Williamsia faeni]